MKQTLISQDLDFQKKMSTSSLSIYRDLQELSLSPALRQTGVYKSMRMCNEEALGFRLQWYWNLFFYQHSSFNHFFQTRSHFLIKSKMHSAIIFHFVCKTMQCSVRVCKKAKKVTPCLSCLTGKMHWLS